MVGRNIAQWIKEDKLPKDIKQYGDTIEQIFIGAYELRKKYGDKYDEITPGAIAVYNYCQRLEIGLKQLMAGARKFALCHISRSDLVALTREAAEVTGIPYIMESDMDLVEKILES